MNIASSRTATILVQSGRVDRVAISFVGGWDWPGGDDVRDISREELFLALHNWLARTDGGLEEDLPRPDSESV